MRLYSATCEEFYADIANERIADVLTNSFKRHFGRMPGKPEQRSWQNSLTSLHFVAKQAGLGEQGVLLEYELPYTSKRLDVMFCGANSAGADSAMIVELKQWSSSRRSEKDAVVWAHRGGPAGEREGPHPSYQAWSYAAYLEDFNTSVREADLGLFPCAYLHNHPRDGEIDHPHYAQHMSRAPLFLARERAKLQAFIRQHVRYGDRRGALYAIENGRIRPSKTLSDSVAAMLQGRSEFVLIDDQKIAHESILAAASLGALRKQVVIVRGDQERGSR